MENKLAFTIHCGAALHCGVTFQHMTELKVHAHCPKQGIWLYADGRVGETVCSYQIFVQTSNNLPSVLFVWIE